MSKLRNKVVLFMMVATTCLAMPVVANTTGSVAPSDWQQEMLMPYVDAEDFKVGGLKTPAESLGIGYYNLGFIVSKEGKPVWYEDRLTKDYRNINEEVKAGVTSLRQIKGDAMVTFGGPEGTPLYMEAQNANKLADMYEDIIKTYNLSAADFYFQGSDLKTNGKLEKEVEMNLDAIKRLPDNFKVWITVEMEQAELTASTKEIIKSAQEIKQLQGINFVIKDYTTLDCKARTPGEVVMFALDHAYQEMSQYIPIDKSVGAEKKIWAKMGVTPVLTKDFDEEDAKDVAYFAKNNGLNRVSYMNFHDDTIDYKVATQLAEILLAPQDLEGQALSFNQVNLSFSEPGLAPKSYQIYRYEAEQKIIDGTVTVEKKANTLKRFSSSTTSFADETVAPETFYIYEVTAMRQSESVPSEALVVYTPEKLPMFKATGVEEEGAVKLTWDSLKDAIGYNVYRDGKLIKTVTEATYTDKNVQKDMTYYYVIKAISKDKGLDQTEIAVSNVVKVTLSESGSLPGDLTGGYKGHWMTGKPYALNDIVKYNNAYYYCTQPHTAVSNWQPSNVPAIWNRIPGEFNELKQIIENKEAVTDDKDKDKDKDKESLGDLNNANGKVWVEGAVYKKGDFVYYEPTKTWYTCVLDHTAHDKGWTPAAVPTLWSVFEGDESDLQFHGITNNKKK